MNNKKPSPSAILFYAPEDDWLARGIADGIDEKEFYIQLSTWCIRSSSEMWQKIRETTNEHTYFLVLLTTHSIERLWDKQEVDENEVYKLSKSLRLIPIVHGLSADKAPRTLLKIYVHEIVERCDVDPLVKHIQASNINLSRLSTHLPLSDVPEILPKPCSMEKDAQFIVQNFLFRISEFQVEVIEVVKKCKWDKARLNLATKWLETRGLVRIKNGLVIGCRPSIDCYKQIEFMDTTRTWGVTGICGFRGQDTLLLKREKFEGKIFNDEGSFDIQLTASADRSGKIMLYVEPTNSIKTGKELLFAYSKMVSLDCTSIQDKNRKLTGDNILIRCKVTEKPVPIWLETDKVVITDKSRNIDLLAKKATEITLCLSEFDCLDSIYEVNFPSNFISIGSPSSPPPEPMEATPAPYVEGLGFLTLKDTFENSIKNRTNKRITATLSITATSDLKNIPEWKKDVSRFVQRIIAVLEFAQGGKLFCPVTEVGEDNRVETTFLLHGESAPQFMPVIQRGKDLKTLIVKVIEKQKLSKDEWQGIEEIISFALSAPNYGEARLLLNLIAIEKLVTLFGNRTRCEGGCEFVNKIGKKCSLRCKIKSFINDRNISFADIEEDSIKRLVENRNSLAHDGKFSGNEDELAPLLAMSHEVLTRIILSIFDFSGWYCSYTCECGVRNFPECNVVNKTNMETLNFSQHLHRWKDLVKQKILSCACTPAFIVMVVKSFLRYVGT